MSAVRMVKERDDIQQQEPERRGRRLAVVMAGCGWTVDELREDLGLQSSTVIYRLLNGGQVLDPARARQIADRAVLHEEWEHVDPEDLFNYLLGGRSALYVRRPDNGQSTQMSYFRQNTEVAA